MVGRGSDGVVQPLQCVVEAGLDRPRGMSSRRRDLVDGQVAVVAQRDDDLVVGRQRRDRRPDDVAVLGTAGVVARREGDLGRDVGRLPSPRPQPVPAGVDEDPVEPWLEPGGVTQGLPLAPGLDERVVRRVLRLGGVAQDRPGQTVGLVEMLVGQPDEGGGAGTGVAGLGRRGRSNSMTSDDRFTMT